MMSEGQENVYGVHVNRAGEMSKLAKLILNLHIMFVVAYFVTGVLSIVRGLTRPETPDMGQQQSMAQENVTSDIVNGIISILGSIGVFFLVRFAIQRDQRDLIQCTLFCDGCCAACNCCLVVFGFLGIAALAAGKAFLTDDLCECSSGITTQCNLANTYQSDACSSCFDKPKCLQSIKEFQDGFGGAFVMLILYTLLVLAEMVCCIVAAVNLSRATNKMQSFPFCRVPPSKQTGMGQPNIIVGQPVVGTVVGEAKLG